MRNKIVLTLFAVLMVITVSAQPAATQKASKAVFSLTTFNAAGDIIASAHGTFVSPQGEAIAPWKPFVGAARAVVIDATGTEHPVMAMIGANELYDVCKFTIEHSTPTVPLAPQAATKTTWLLPYSVQKAKPLSLTIQRIEQFNERFNYYVFNPSTLSAQQVGCPVVNAQGQLCGLLQTTSDGTFTAVDARFATEMQANSLALSNATLRTCAIRPALPASLDDATVALLMSANLTDSLTHQSLIDAFIQQFPAAKEGYTNKALSLVDAGKDEEAEKVMQTALEKVERKDEAYSEYAKVILQKQIHYPNRAFAPWSLDKALQAAEKAATIQPLPQYIHQQAQIYYAKQDYQKAYDLFMQLTHTPLRSGELFYEASQCKRMLRAPITEALALLDSAVAVCPRPLNSIASTYLLARGATYQEMGQYRLAVKDYNTYDSIAQGPSRYRDFYYQRYQCELKIKQFQQALNDLARTILLNPEEPVYYAEMASLCLRVKRNEDAEQAALRCTEIATDYADGFLLLGIARQELGKPEEARKALLRAKELGDKRADEYLKKK